MSSTICKLPTFAAHAFETSTANHRVQSWYKIFWYFFPPHHTSLIRAEDVKFALSKKIIVFQHSSVSSSCLRVLIVYCDSSHLPRTFCYQNYQVSVLFPLYHDLCSRNRFVAEERDSKPRFENEYSFEPRGNRGTVFLSRSCRRIVSRRGRRGVPAANFVRMMNARALTSATTLLRRDCAVPRNRTSVRDATIDATTRDINETSPRRAMSLGK